VNIVFDLGGVIVAYNRPALIAELYPDPAIETAVRAALLEHPDWAAMDRGTLSEPDAIARAALRSRLPAPQLARFIERMSISWRLIPGTVDLLYRLRAKGHAIFCLSNMHPASIEFLEREFSFWGVFTGTVISCRVGFCKPEPAIYAHLLERFTLSGSDTVFIDDLETNLAAAEPFGIRTIKFDDPAQCSRALRARGIEGA